MSQRRPSGPSGDPVLHFVQCNSRKEAKDRAQEAGEGNPPIHHTAHEPGQQPHFHPADKDGNIYKDGSHYQYPG